MIGKKKEAFFIRINFHEFIFLINILFRKYCYYYNRLISYIYTHTHTHTKIFEVSVNAYILFGVEQQNIRLEIYAFMSMYAFIFCDNI